MRKDVLGVMAVAMLLIVGLIAPATATGGEVEAEPDAELQGEAEVLVAEAVVTKVPKADPCKAEGPYTYKHDVSDSNAAGSVNIMYEGEHVGTIAYNTPGTGQVTLTLDAGYVIDLCVFGGNARQEHPGVTDGFVSGALVNPGGEDAGVSNFAWAITEVPDNGDEVIELDGVQGTFICLAEDDGMYDLYISADQGFARNQELNAGDYVFRFINPNTTDVKFSAGTPAGNDNVVSRWEYLEAHDYTFTTFPDAIAGVSTNTVTAGNGDGETPINRGTFSTNDHQLCEASDVDATVTITRVKEWFDFDDNPVTEPEGIAWGINLFVGADEEPSASLPGTDNVVTMELLEDGAPARYGIQEEPAPEGWEAVPCEGLTETEYVNEGTSALLFEGGAESGAFGADRSGVHLVCNQEEEVGTSPATGPRPRPTPEPDTTSIAFVKDWGGDDFEGSDDVVVTFDVDIDGTTVTLGDGVVSEPFDAEANWEVIGENVTGFPVDECSYIPTIDTGTFVGEVATYTVTNFVTCDEVGVLPGEPVEPEPEVVTPAPEPEVVTPAPTVEVRGEVVTRTTPTRIDSGTGGSLDNTGLLALLLTGGLALSGFGITSAATTRRRR